MLDNLCFFLSFKEIYANKEHYLTHFFFDFSVE